MIRLKISFPRILLNLNHLIFDIISTYLFIPFLTMHMIIFKYTFISESGVVREYYDERVINVNRALASFGPVIIAIVVATTYLNKVLSNKISHYTWKSSLNSRSNSRIEVYAIAFDTLMVFLFCLLSVDHPRYFH